MSGRAYTSMPSARLVTQERSAVVPDTEIQRSRFINRFTRLMTFDAGYLVPFMVKPVYPGDHLRYAVTAFLRMATPTFPVFTNQRVDFFFFFTPYRILWSNFEKFMGYQVSPGDSTAFLIPIVNSAVGGFPINSIYDHMGIPVVGQTAGGGTEFVSALPFRAYNRIYNDFFRDQNLIPSQFLTVGDGPDVVGNYALQRRAKRPDYFTTMLPFPQKFTAPNIPLTGTAPVIGIGTRTGNFTAGPINVTESIGGGPVSYPFYRNTDAPANEIAIRGNQAAGGKPEIYANLSLSTATFTINTLRNAFAIQTLYERDALGGTRYIEQVWSHFKVRSSDGRLDRPELCGGGSMPFQLSPIAQTAPSAGVPVGALGASAVATGQIRSSFVSEEHGCMIGLINVVTELAYQQGVPRWLSERSREELMWPELAGLGEQPVLMKEIFSTGQSVNDAVVLGYQERYHHLRTEYSDVTGMFRSTTAGTIDPWHAFQRFTVAPALNQTFIEDTPPMSRILAAGALANNQQYMADILIESDIVRALPMFGRPARLI